MRLFAKVPLVVAAVVASTAFFTKNAAAGLPTLSQTVNLTLPFGPISPATGDFVFPVSAYNAVFEPFVGAGLQSAVWSFSLSASGSGYSDSNASAQNGESAGFAGGGTFYFDGVGFNGTGLAPINGTILPNTQILFTGSTSVSNVELYTGFGNQFDPTLTGNQLITFSWGNGTSTPPLTYSVAGTSNLSGTISITETLVYTYSGPGALATIGQSVPEPASMALFGMGLAGMGVLVRRRRG